MKRSVLITAVVICGTAFAAPVAWAQAVPFTATYTEHFDPPAGNPRCPDETFACGGGTAAEFGSFTSTLGCTPPDCATRTMTLTFADGSTLALIEAIPSVTGPGNSGAGSHESPKAEGNPGVYTTTWTVVGGTGTFAGASGSGTDSYLSAGLIASGALSGTIATK